MDLATYKRRRAIVDRIFNIGVEEHYLDPDFVFTLSEETRITKTGHLRIFAIEPRSESLPGFYGRWDHGKEVLDIDFSGGSKSNLKSFKKDRDGYSGHHPKRISKDKRTFQVEISIPNRLVYKGHISFNINHTLELTESISLEDRITFIAGKPGLLFRLMKYLRRIWVGNE